MAYFAVVLASTEDGWESNEIDLDEVDTLSDLADAMRDSAEDEDAEGPFILLLEQEDEWFAVVRVDGDEDPRVFVSDRSAVEHSAYAEMLLEGAADAELEAELDSADDESEDDEDEREDPIAEHGPVGDAEILADHGTDAGTLLKLSDEGVLPSEALSALASRAGAANALETVR